MLEGEKGVGERDIRNRICKRRIELLTTFLSRPEKKSNGIGWQGEWEIYLSVRRTSSVKLEKDFGRLLLKRQRRSHTVDLQAANWPRSLSHSTSYVVGTTTTLRVSPKNCLLRAL